MSNKKKRPKLVDSRINRLFADLVEEASAVPVSSADPGVEAGGEGRPTSSATTLLGWKWDCDAQGLYLDISEDVEASLGRPPSEFIGKPLASYCLTPASSQFMQKTLAKLTPPFEVDVEYLGARGNRIPVRLYFTGVSGIDESESGLRGYAQPLTLSQASASQISSSPSTSKQPKPASSPLLHAIEDTREASISIKQQSRTPQPAKVDITPTGQVAFSTPFQVQNNEQALLELIDDTPGRIWSEDERRLVEQVADQLSLALENARLFQETQAALAETQTLYAITSATTRSLELREALGSLLEQVLRTIGVESGLISMADQFTGELEVIVEHALPETILNSMAANSLHGTLCELVFQRKEALSIADFDHPKGYESDNPSLGVLREMGYRSYMGVPLESKGRILGTLCTFGQSPRPEQDASMALLQVAGQQIGIAIENAQLFQETQSRAEELSVLNEMGRTLATYLDVNEVTEALYSYVSRLMNTYSFFVSLYNEEKDEMELPVVYTSGKRIYPPKRKLGKALSDYVIRNRVSLLLNGEDITEQQEALGVHFVGLGDAKPAKSWLGVPLLYGDQILGAVVVQSVDKPFLYVENHRRLLTAVASQAAIAIQNARLFERTQAVLGETASLYQASAALNTAQSYPEILEALRRYTIAGAPAHHVNISYFDHPWSPSEQPEWVDVLARWTEPADQDFMPRYPLQAYPAIASLLKRDVPLIVENFAEDERFDETSRETYMQLFKASSAIFVPLVVGFQWVGFINANYPQSTQFIDEDVRRLMALAGQAAVAIQNLRSVAVAEQQAREAQRRSEELALVNRVVSAMVSSADLSQVLDAVATELVQAFNLAHASIALLDPQAADKEARDHLTVVSEKAAPGLHPIGSLEAAVKIHIRGNQAIEQVLNTRRPVSVTAAQTSPLLAPMQVYLHDRAIHAIAFFPIIVGGDVIGIIILDSIDKERAFTPQELSLAETLVGQISTSIQSANLYEQNILLLDETRRRVQELSVLFELSQSLAGVALATHEIAYIISQYFIRIMEYPEVTVYNLDVELGELNLLETLIIDEKTKQPVRQQDVQSGQIQTNIRVTQFPAALKVMQTLKPLVLKAGDGDLDPSESRYLLDRGIKSQIALPLAVKGLVLGLISLQSYDRERLFTPDQLNLAMTLANSAATALENASLYETQKQTSEQLRELDKLKSQFLANMSHELRTPLNSIIGFSRVILKGIDGPVSELQKQDLTAINSAGQHLLQLINDVLDISKIEAGKMELAFDDEVHLGDLITSAMSTAVGLTRDKPIVLEKHIAPDLPTVRCDPTRIRQVLINFLSNAAKFTEKGSITVEALTSQDSSGSPEVMVRVIDTGAGISAADQSRLFQPFSQVDASPTRKVGGSGLGLSISRLLIELHNGRIGVHSEPGQGSTFFFTIPLTPAIPRISPVDEGKAQDLDRDLSYTLEFVSGTFRTTAPPGKLILTIDDDRAVLNLYERYLVEHGYRVIPLLDPAQAVAVASKTQPFAITLDIMMPRVDGWQVLEELKGNPVTRDIPVIVCSIVENQEKGFSLGAVGYLTKPLLQDDLVSALDRLNVDGTLREVLLIDDKLEDLRLVQRILEDEGGYQVRLANGGVEGLVELQSRPPHAVVLDLFMPDLDGFSILETMHSDENLAHIPVIIFTAGDLNEQQLARLSEFSKSMLHKSSFKESELLGSLDSLLNKMK